MASMFCIRPPPPFNSSSPHMPDIAQHSYESSVGGNTSECHLRE
jgi:hypothetical protein